MGSYFKSLAPYEMIEVYSLPLSERKNLFIGGCVDHNNQHILLFRGDGTSLTVNFSNFESNAKYSPDFSNLEIIDYGHTVKLGNYEASTKSILIKFDFNYN